MKILLINTLYHPNGVGGAEKSVQLLAEGLTEHSQSALVVTLAPERRCNKTNIAGVEVHYIPIKNIYHPMSEPYSLAAKALWHIRDIYNPAMSRSVSRIIKQYDPDVVHTNNLSGISVAIWHVAKQLGYPVVHTLRDYYLICPRTTMYRDGQNCEYQCIKCKTFSLIKKILSKQVDAVVGISRFILDRHTQLGYFDQASKHVVYNPFGKYEPRHAAFPISRGINFGYIGSIVPSKGLDRLLPAFLRLGRKAGATKLYIGGKIGSRYALQLAAMYSNSGIEWLGYIQPYNFFQKINILIVPSRWHEPAGRVVVEAMSYGVPVIGSARGGIPELIGDAGWVFDPDIPGDLEARMEYVLQNPDVVEEYSQRALERVSKFDIETSVKKYIEIYQSLL